MAVVLEPKGKRLDLRLSGPGYDWDGWFTVLTQLTTDDDPVYGPAPKEMGLDQQQRAVGRHIQGLDGTT